MAATEPGAAPNDYTLGRLFRTYLKALLVGAILAVGFLAVVFVALYWMFVLAPGPRAEAIAPVVDGLRVPADWELVEQQVQETGYVGGCDRFLNPNCPSLRRVYEVDGDVQSTAADVREMLTAAGVDIDAESDPTCPTAATAHQCYLAGNVGDIRFAVTLSRPGDDVASGPLDRVKVHVIATHHPLPTPVPGASP